VRLAGSVQAGVARLDNFGSGAPEWRRSPPRIADALPARPAIFHFGEREMSSRDDDNDSLHVVVVNHEEQYALWPDYSPVPAGWTQVFGPDKKPPCLEYVKQNWTDMRPKSLRDAMADRS
jgi:MbtH protein